MNISLLIFIILASVSLALLEIQIEGGDGWAKNLPTWKIHNPFHKILNWEHLTGYHFYLWIFLLVVFQLPFFFGLKFNLENITFILEILCLTILLEDFLWFVLNPKWGIRRFLHEEIPWQSKKILFLPRNYWVVFIFLTSLEIIRKTYF